MAGAYLTEANNIRRLADNFTNSDRGRLLSPRRIPRRYALPGIIKEFRTQYPQVQLVLHQAAPVKLSMLLEW